MNPRDWRKQNGLTQQALADALGLTNSAITKYEKGSQRPRPELAKRIENFTRGEVTATSLLGVPESRTRQTILREDAELFNSGGQLTISLTVTADQARLLESAGADVKAVARAGGREGDQGSRGEGLGGGKSRSDRGQQAWIETRGTFAEQLGLVRMARFDVRRLRTKGRINLVVELQSN